jgi:hypothetical protein
MSSDLRFHGENCGCCCRAETARRCRTGEQAEVSALRSMLEGFGVNDANMVRGQVALGVRLTVTSGCDRDNQIVRHRAPHHFRVHTIILMPQPVADTADVFPRQPGTQRRTLFAEPYGRFAEIASEMSSNDRLGSLEGKHGLTRCVRPHRLLQHIAVREIIACFATTAGHRSLHAVACRPAITRSILPLCSAPSMLSA